MVVKHIISLLIVGHLLVLTRYSISCQVIPENKRSYSKSVFTVMALHIPAAQMDTFCTSTFSTTPLCTFAASSRLCRGARSISQHLKRAFIPVKAHLSALFDVSRATSVFCPTLGEKTDAPALGLAFPLWKVMTGYWLQPLLPPSRMLNY